VLSVLLAFLVSFGIGVILAPIIISSVKKLKANQTVLHYVTAHKCKDGTPTLGGLIFIIATAVGYCIFCDGQAGLGYIALAVMLGYGLVGFLDDFIKIKTHKNEGLKPYQKVVGQLGIAILTSIFVYINFGGEMYLPVGLSIVDIGWLIIPFVIFVYIAMTNSTNLTDGLDGLAGGVSIASIGGLVGLIVVMMSGNNVALLANEQYYNLLVLGVCSMGGILAFLCYNSHPAKIFMGDTGSLALGGLIASLALFSGQALVLPIICIMFAISSVSVIIQVLHYKRTKKRIFLMAPLHHHFEKKGVNETKIVAIYIIVTIMASVLAVILSQLGR